MCLGAVPLDPRCNDCLSVILPYLQIDFGTLNVIMTLRGVQPMMLLRKLEKNVGME